MLKLISFNVVAVCFGSCFCHVLWLAHFLIRLLARVLARTLQDAKRYLIWYTYFCLFCHQKRVFCFPHRRWSPLFALIHASSGLPRSSYYRWCCPLADYTDNWLITSYFLSSSHASSSWVFFIETSLLSTCWFHFFFLVSSVGLSMRWWALQTR